MSPAIPIHLAPLAAGLTAWFLSGSPVPMMMSGLILALAPLFGWVGKRETLRIPGLTIAALVIALAWFAQIRMFQTGIALAVGAQLPALFHLSLALLWGVALGYRFSSSSRIARLSPTVSTAGITGSLGLIAATLVTELYDFGPWQVYPIAILPLATYLLHSFFGDRPLVSHLFVGAAGILAITGFSLALREGTDQVSEWVHSDESDLDDYDSDDRPQFDSGTGGGDGSSRRLARSADIRFDDQVRMFLRTDSRELFRSWTREPLYVRTSTVTIFESDEVISTIRSGRWIYDSDDEDNDHRVVISEARPSRLADYTLYIQRDAASALPLLPKSHLLHTEAVYEFADDWLQLAPAEEIKRLRYTASAPAPAPRASPTRLASIEALSNRIPGIYLSMPPSPLADRIRRLVEPLPSNNVITAVRDAIQSRARYSLTYETPDRMSPVENFLFGERKGHCELYAASTVLMLRARGIPCRLAYGFTGGMADPKQNLIAFRDRDFHAWAEVLTNDRTWEIFDTTPTSLEATARIPARTSVGAADWASYEDFSRGGSDFDDSTFSFATELAELTAFVSRNFLVLTLLGLALPGGAWWWRRFRRSSSSSAGAESANESTTRLADELLSELRACGSRFGIGKREGQTWREFLSELTAKTPLPPSAAEAVDYYYGIRYIGTRANPATEETIRRELSEWRKTLDKGAASGSS